MAPGCRLCGCAQFGQHDVDEQPASPVNARDRLLVLAILSRPTEVSRQDAQVAAKFCVERVQFVSTAVI